MQRAIGQLPFDLPSEVVEREILGFVIQIGDFRKEFDFDRRAGAVVKRDKLDAFLARQAEKAGAELLMETETENLTEGMESVIISTNHGNIECRAMIDAEGVTSRTARTLLGPYPRENLAMGMASDIDFEGDAGNKIEIHLFDTPTRRGRPWPDFPLNGWVFPHATGANIGVVGKEASKQRMQASVFEIQRRLEGSYGPIARSDSLCAHPLPLVPRARLHTRRVLVVGDAAGFVNPITGEGMSYAFLSGKFAAQSITEMLGVGGKLAMIERYDLRCGAILKDLSAAAQISPILHRLVGVVDTKAFFENFQHEKALVGICLKIARGEGDWRLLLQRTIARFPLLFFGSLR